LDINVMGLDASLTSSGIAIVSAADAELKHHQVITVNKRDMARLKAIREEVNELIHRHSVKLVSLEGYAFARANQAHQIGELGGTLKLFFFDNDIPFIIITPGQVKKYATGKGNAKKPEMAVGVYKKWGVEFPTDDETDAFVLAKIGEALVQRAHDELYSDSTMPELTKYQREVVNDLWKKWGGVVEQAIE